MKKLTDEEENKLIDDGNYCKPSTNPRAQLKSYVKAYFRAARKKAKQAKEARSKSTGSVMVAGSISGTVQQHQRRKQHHE